jgi:CRP-like cAMP-binding protein
MIAIMSGNLVDLLKGFRGRRRAFAAGEYLFHLGERVTALFVVLDGEVHLIRHQEDGNAVVLQRAGADEILAEASLFSDRYHCDAVARTHITVQSIPTRDLLGRLSNEPDFAKAWAAHLARKIHIMRFRSEILSRKTVASRLDAWLAWQGELPPKGQWKEIADQIGVSPEALYREIARRRV